jgi:perosamine synthetase
MRKMSVRRLSRTSSSYSITPLKPTTMATDRIPAAEIPAILGGDPVRPEGPPDWPPDDPAVAEVLKQVIKDKTWGKYHGPHCDELSEKLAEYHQSEHVVLCSSGTAAIELALRGLKIGPGDEVILAAYDFKGNFQNVLTVGATPVLVDIRPENWNLDADLIGAAIGPNTQAIIVSHLHGGIVPMAAVMKIAELRGLAVIEDACQMPGAIIEGKKAGVWGDVGVLSFGGSKLLSAGRGGALMTNNAECVQRAKLYSHRGNESYPLSELQAAVLIPQLEQLDSGNNRRTKNAKRLCKRLVTELGLIPFRNCENAEASCTRHSSLVTHHSSLNTQSSTPGYYKLGFQYDPSAFDGLTRDLFSEAIRAEGIAIDSGFHSLHKIHSQRRYRKPGELPNADKADDSVLVLHHPVLLGEESDIEQIVIVVDKIRRNAEMILNSHH